MDVINNFEGGLVMYRSLGSALYVPPEGRQGKILNGGDSLDLKKAAAYGSLVFVSVVAMTAYPFWLSVGKFVTHTALPTIAKLGAGKVLGGLGIGLLGGHVAAVIGASLLMYGLYRYVKGNSAKKKESVQQKTKKMESNVEKCQQIKPSSATRPCSVLATLSAFFGNPYTTVMCLKESNLTVNKVVG
jgi:hypothetical protein